MATLIFEDFWCRVAVSAAACATFDAGLADEKGPEPPCP
jgi:hypothetical protein